MCCQVVRTFSEELRVKGVTMIENWEEEEERERESVMKIPQFGFVLEVGTVESVRSKG